MKKLLTSVSMSAIILAAALAIGAISTNQASATDTVIAQTNEGQSGEEAASEAEDYTYIAQPGDSYSQMARKAMQTYGIEVNGEIGAAGVLFAETNLTSLAGWPELHEGQTVTISRASVKEWFDKASQLSADEKANWDYYVQFVDFNTNSVGEASKS